MRGWRALGAVLRDRRMVATFAVAALLVGANWLIYVYAVVSGHVNSASLGYYINPLFTVLLGVVVLGERLRRLQVVALAVAAVAVVVIGVGMGEFPWISLALAASFGLYGLVKKRAGASVDAVTGLTVETMVLAPLGLVALLVIGGSGTFGVRGEEALGLGHDLLMMSTGIFTAGALLLFAAGARRLPLFAMGILQYIAPTLMFALAVWQFGEPMPTSRWAGFVLVWVALVIITWDAWSARPRRGVAQVEPAEPV
ncbi:EamA family transporter RarD [Demequina sp. NBRC 110057]|uniref:EamA family transporter RarD n=1 Tax=Demequina sp. NBRC 110057 TaxID=1570346 RepID=UPI001F2FAB90|nr:EamA family transporter RarD [Demequina sp. NBRC 110057]